VTSGWTAPCDVTGVRSDALLPHQSAWLATAAAAAAAAGLDAIAFEHY